VRPLVFAEGDDCVGLRVLQERVPPVLLDAAQLPGRKHGPRTGGHLRLVDGVGCGEGRYGCVTAVPREFVVHAAEAVLYRDEVSVAVGPPLLQPDARVGQKGECVAVAGDVEVVEADVRTLLQVLHHFAPVVVEARKGHLNSEKYIYSNGPFLFFLF
jgi:hypothetical protein